MKRRGFFGAVAAAFGAAAACAVGARAASAAPACQTIVVDRVIPRLHAQIGANLRQAEISIEAMQKMQRVAAESFRLAESIQAQLAASSMAGVDFCADVPAPAIESSQNDGPDAVTRA